MLTSYKKSQKKIAMGLLSFTPEGRNLKQLCQIIDRYDAMQDWHLYLWKEGEDFVGVVGIEEASGSFTVHHVAVLPSHRGENRAHRMLGKLQQLMQHRGLKPTEETARFLAGWQQVKLG